MAVLGIVLCFISVAVASFSLGFATCNTWWLHKLR